MTDPIRIPLSPTDHMLSDGIIITPEIARQIVALSAVPAMEANTLHRLASIEDHSRATQQVVSDHYRELDKRITALEAQKAWLMQHAVVGGAEGKEAQPTAPVRTLTPDDLRAVCVQTHQDGDVRLPDGTWGKPTAQGDEAAVVALRGITTGSDCGTVHAVNPVHSYVAARAILAAIRDGKVPGVYACKSDAEIGRYHVAYCEQMKQERDKALADLAAYAGLFAENHGFSAAQAAYNRMKADLAAERKLREEAESARSIHFQLRERSEAKVAALAAAINATVAALEVKESHQSDECYAYKNTPCCAACIAVNNAKAALAAAGETTK